MAEFAMTVADADLARLTIAICAGINVSFTSSEISPPDPEAARQVVMQFIQQVVVAYETTQAKNAIVPPVLS